MDGFVRDELKLLPANGHPLRHPGYQVHLNPVHFFIEERAVTKIVRIDISPKLILDAMQQIQIKRRRIALGVIIGRVENGFVFLQIDPDEKASIGSDNRPDVSQEITGFFGGLIADGGARKKGEALR